MKKLKDWCLSTGVWAFFIVMVVIIGGYGLSWLLTCGLIKLITLCFGWKFSWAIATGIWLCTCLFTMTFARAGRGN